MPVVVHEANASAGWANKRRCPVGATGAVRGRRIPGCGAPRSSGCRCARRSPHSTGWRCGRRPAPTSDSPRTPGAAGVRRLAGRAVDQPGGRRRRQRPCRRRCLGAARARPEEHPGAARARRRRPAVRRRAVPGPDGPGLRRRRSGDLPVRRDDGGRGVGGRAARGVRAAAHRQRRAATQRAARGRCRRRAHCRRRRPDTRVRRRHRGRAARRRGPAAGDDGGRGAGGPPRRRAAGGRGRPRGGAQQAATAESAER